MTDTAQDGNGGGAAEASGAGTAPDQATGHSTGQPTDPAADHGPEESADDTPRAGRTTNLVCGAVVALTGVGTLAVALDLGLGSLSQPGAGTWPGIVSMILIVIGLLIAARAATFTDAEPITKDAVAVAVAVVALAVAVQLFPYVGFELPSVALLVFWMSVLGQEKLRLSVPISVIAVAVFYLTFVYGLAVPIPRLF
ncbi:tripartite tricarboxylate transporter TctB family protein [Nocardiopsis sp. HNM0947]|uniref:Tripartite tricarboxylate transporter TctB family protein n=1 Tax=Nocardiopsis coralli TaxID=2772213 RepID=A0ABR9PDP1_9ACTN|nr:tripartite tricarboxylate transporter TctB family protein [Nocardiopsis coralli]MBE3001963.1 tripartite tricarboxylate transporter TctB family protein [Nocardiopsis coralli]